MSGFDDWLGDGTQAAAPAAASDGGFSDWLGDAPTTQAPAKAAAAPTPAPKQSGAPAALPSFAQGVADKVMGGTQGIVHGLAWAANKVAPDSEFAKEATQGAADVDARISAVNSQYEAARKAAGGSGLDLGRMGGNAAAALPLFALGGGGSLGARVLTSAAQGAADSALAPVDMQPGQSYAGSKAKQVATGATVGAVVPAAFAGIGATGRGLWNAISPVLNPARYVGRGMAGTYAPATAATLAANIRNAPNYVPGSLPTTAQVAGDTGMVQTEKAAANAFPAIKTALVDRGTANNAARWDVINGVAGTDADLAAAVAARRAAAAPAVDSLLTNGNPVSATPILNAIDNTLNGSLGTNPAIRGALNDMRNQITGNVAGGTRANWIAPDILDGLRQNANDFIAKHAPNGVVQTRQAVAMDPIREAITNAVESANPGYRQYLADYAANSQPINTMQAGRQIAEELSNRAQNPQGLPILQSNNFRGPLARAIDGQPHGIDPQAQAALEAVQSDLARATRSNSIRVGGSDTAYNLAATGRLARALYGPTFGGATGTGKALAAGATALAGHPYAAIGVLGAANRVGQAVGARLTPQLQNYLLNPQALLPYLDAQAAGPTARGALGRIAAQNASPLVVNGLLSGQ